MKVLSLITCLFLGLMFMSHTTTGGGSYQTGEFLKYRVHYGIFNAAFATLEVRNSKLNNNDYLHVLGKGKTSGALRFFFKVDDKYETYINPETKLPKKFIRKINEGGYIKDKELVFNHEQLTVTVNDKKNKRVTNHKITENIQDLLSSFYYLRGLDTNKYKPNDMINIDVFLDEEIYPFRLKVLKRETIKTKFGKVKTIKIRPYVSKGRIFEEEESLTIWVTDDQNHIPIKIKADLMVGSLKVDLHEFKNLKNTTKFY